MLTVTIAKRYYSVNSKLRVPRGSWALFNPRMDVSEARRANFTELLKQYGTIEALADKTGSSSRHLSQVKNHGRNIGHRVARRFEQRLELPRGWMDTRDHTPAQGSLEVAAMIQDFRKLPTGLQAHVAAKTAELRELWEAIPATMRPLITDPPRDPERYREWEGNIRALASEAAQRGAQ